MVEKQSPEGSYQLKQKERTVVNAAPCDDIGACGQAEAREPARVERAGADRLKREVLLKDDEIGGRITRVAAYEEERVSLKKSVAGVQDEEPRLLRVEPAPPGVGGGKGQPPKQWLRFNSHVL